MNTNRVYLILLGLYILYMATACSKIKETAIERQPPLDYGKPSLPNIETIIKSRTDISIYKEMYAKSGVAEFIDSVRKVTHDNLSPFTFFIPRDATWQANGYTLEKARAISPDSCKSLLMYLTVQGVYLPDSVTPTSINNSLYPIIPPKKVEVLVSSGITIKNNFYNLSMGWWNKNIYLNGKKAGSVANSILPASNGAVYIVDALPLKPEKTVYELLTEDPSYSLYLTAIRISNRVYIEHQVGISPDNKAEEYFGVTPIPFSNFFNTLIEFVPNDQIGDDPSRVSPSYFVFAPDNKAFEKAGFADSTAIDTYIRKSYITTESYVEETNRVPMYTNMDSLLSYTFFSRRQSSGSELSYGMASNITNIYNRPIYTSDMQWDPILKNQGLKQGFSIIFYDWKYYDENLGDFTQTYKTSWSGDILFQINSNNTIIKRSNAPNGRSATIIPEYSDKNALNGVLFRVDNLLLPTP